MIYLVVLADAAESVSDAIRFEILKRIGPVAYRLRLPEELSTCGNIVWQAACASGEYRDDKKDVRKKTLKIIEVPRSIAEHRLNIREGCPPIMQKKWGQAPDKSKEINEEVSNLVETGIIREVHYHNWITNPVLEKKHGGSWRISYGTTSIAKDIERSTKSEWEIGKPKHILVQVCEKIIAFLQNPKKGDIVSNKGKQFAENPFRYWCEKLKIKERITFVMHPQTNRLVERANIGLGEGIKAYLDKGKEKSERVVVREAKSKAKMEKYYNDKVRITLFNPDDFVYRNNDASHVEDTGKFGPKWEGPYEVVKALGK
ncbi:reverse transcriptase domain-containing protein [Tanacetum coccineum]